MRTADINIPRQNRSLVLGRSIPRLTRLTTPRNLLTNSNSTTTDSNTTYTVELTSTRVKKIEKVSCDAFAVSPGSSSQGSWFFGPWNFASTSPLNPPLPRDWQDVNDGHKLRRQSSFPLP
jgi:hypothetical protein